jgi:hypothetical protein
MKSEPERACHAMPSPVAYGTMRGGSKHSWKIITRYIIVQRVFADLRSLTVAGTPGIRLSRRTD